ncbi:MAG: tyrosine-type recombinase/integrase [Clostridium sp.]
MRNNVTSIFKQDTINNSNDKITETLYKYTEKVVNKDKTVTYIDIPTSYFLENNKWNLSFFENVTQFNEESRSINTSTKNIIDFSFSNENINREMKFIVYNKLFKDEWNLKTLVSTQKHNFTRLSKFINEKFPRVDSILDLDIEKANVMWIDWLASNSIKVTRQYIVNSRNASKTCNSNTYNANFLNFIYKTLKELLNNIDEWEKDIWDIRKLEKYGLSYNKSVDSYNIKFNKIKNIPLKIAVKRYIKQRLLSKNKFSLGTAAKYMQYIPKFLNFICDLEPSWNDLNDLERYHIEEYLEWLSIYTKEHKIINDKEYINSCITTVQKFLSDIQLREYDVAPSKNIRVLVFPEDKPKIPKISNEKIDYIPDFILEQLFCKINNLHNEVTPVVYTMFKTGLRISDVLGLKQSCLVKLNNTFWIETDIEKTYVKGHRIPIDDEIANMLAVLIDSSNKYSNEDNNPENYIFVRYNGSRKGKPYSRGWILDKLNLFSETFDIRDESGNVYRFKNHSFRHTYAIKLLNGGADILTVQELLAHASPEMTMRYAKLLDDTKRKVFDNAVKQGIFSFDESDKLKEENDGEIPSDIIDMLYTNHKLNALDTPYGTCMQRKNGKCSYAKQPPCLTCNNGSPCKDLCVGAFEGDTVKYEILINSTKTMIENAKIYNRDEMVSENEELLNLYQDIYSKISQGSMIYSRLDKLKKKVD